MTRTTRPALSFTTTGPDRVDVAATHRCAFWSTLS